MRNITLPIHSVHEREQFRKILVPMDDPNESAVLSTDFRFRSTKDSNGYAATYDISNAFDIITSI